ncbi:reverse transcriptase domain-containing protein, partial [Tanacetum coccineum]
MNSWPNDLTDAYYELDLILEETTIRKNSTSTRLKIKTSLEEPPTDLELIPLPDNLKYVFLEEPSFLPMIISSKLSTQNKIKLVYVLKKHKEAFAWKTIDIPGECLSGYAMPQLHSKDACWQSSWTWFSKIIEVVNGLFFCLWRENSFAMPKLILDKMLQRCKDAHLVLNWEKCHFMVKEGIGFDLVDYPFVDLYAEYRIVLIFYGFRMSHLVVWDRIWRIQGVLVLGFLLSEFHCFWCAVGMTVIWVNPTFRVSFDLGNLDGIAGHAWAFSFIVMVTGSFNDYIFLTGSLIQECEGIVLGHKVSGARLEVDKAKIDVISKLPPSTNIKGVRNFLRHAGFYRHFIKDFSKIVRPTPFEFNDECQKAFEILKVKLTCAPVIISPNWNLSFELMCDASDFAAGAVLGQKD